MGGEERRRRGNVELSNRGRLGPVGTVSPSVELTIRDMTSNPTDADLNEIELCPHHGATVATLAKALRACRQALDGRTHALNSLLSIVEDDHRDMTGESKLRDLKQRSKAKDAVVEAIRKGRPSIRAFLDHFNPNNLLESTGRQWIATSEMLDRIDDTLAALDNLPSVAKQRETDNADG